MKEKKKKQQQRQFPGCPFYQWLYNLFGLCSVLADFRV